MINLTMQTQPDDETCGPTCLHAIYHYYNYDMSLQKVVNTVKRAASGGTLAALLGNHALKNNFNATIYVNNLDVFDPTWFHHGEASAQLLINKLEAQMQIKHDVGIVQSSIAYQKFLRRGGAVKFQTLNVQLLKNYFDKKIPILTGLSATYLYFSAREHFTTEGISYYDDVGGTPCGHFVVLCGYDDHRKHVIVADPHRENPLSHDHYYKVSSHRLINAILLGVLTHDANLLIIQPK